MPYTGSEGEKIEVLEPEEEKQEQEETQDHTHEDKKVVLRYGVPDTRGK